MSDVLAPYSEALAQATLTKRIGEVKRLVGLAIDVEGLDASLGEVCAVRPRGSRGMDAPALRAEVIAAAPGRATLMAYGALDGLAPGAHVEALGLRQTIGATPDLLGRVIDGWGQPLDGRPPVVPVRLMPLKASAPNPLQRPRIAQALETGVRTLDALLTIGQGQRVGIFAGSGVGKSTLLGMLAQHARSQVNVIALIGERGREVREFIEKQLGAEGLARSVVLVATADQPALARTRAAYAAVALAEYFRDAGKQVMLMMDSITRFAMARREIGLAAGEPPTARGYTPSVFTELPQLCERCGTAPGGGSITALMTVLVDGDDFNEPVSDSLRAILDGHIVLSRQLAHLGIFPAIDVLKSASRVMPDVTTEAERKLARRATELISLLERNRAMVEIGAYEAGTNPALDAALDKRARLEAWLAQSAGGIPRAKALAELGAIA
jgi:flagellum-specific ATP synthase